jgi:L-lactate utilization protein LutC
MNKWNTLAPDQIVEKTAKKLDENNMKTTIVETGIDAKKLIETMIPKDAEVMTATSETLKAIGVTEHINESGHHDAVMPKLMKMNRDTHHLEMQKLGAAPEYIIGSVHAITEDGTVVIASNSGSQLPGYAYGSTKVIWVVSTKKIVENLDEAFKRIYDYVLPLESERARKAYGVPGSFVSKMLIVNREITPDRIHVIFVKEALGY